MGKRNKSRNRYRVSLDSNACIGCLACTRCEVFEVGEDMRAHVVRSESDDLGFCREVVGACPVGAIAIRLASAVPSQPQRRAQAGRIYPSAWVRHHRCQQPSEQPCGSA